MFFFLLIPRPQRSPLFPYTTLFRSDFAYFNHSIHINKGVGCTTCHGPVDRMPLMWQEQSLQMAWCIECHRSEEHTSELQSRRDLVCRLLLEKKKQVTWKQQAAGWTL